MERTLVIVRHAKSDWGTPGQADADRPLNNRGKRDAPVMGARLKARGIRPDLLLSSPANRAATTARLIAGALDYPEAAIQWVPALYHCPAHGFEEVLLAAGIPDEVRTVMLFSHNPGITHFANDTLPGLNVDNIPTCGMAGITFDALHWSDYSTAAHRLLFFDYPKNQL